MAEFLGTDEESRAFFVPLVMSLVDQTDENLAAATFRRLSEELTHLSGQNRKSIAAWIGRLRRCLEQDARQREAAAIARLESALSGLAA
jgi:hypothetical protein